MSNSVIAKLPFLHQPNEPPTKHSKWPQLVRTIKNRGLNAEMFKISTICSDPKRKTSILKKEKSEKLVKLSAELPTKPGSKWKGKGPFPMGRYQWWRSKIGRFGLYLGHRELVHRPRHAHSANSATLTRRLSPPAPHPGRVPGVTVQGKRRRLQPVKPLRHLFNRDNLTNRERLKPHLVISIRMTSSIKLSSSASFDMH